MRKYKTGATRGDDSVKPDPEGFISPSVLKKFSEYMHFHRMQADGEPRESDNWQKGMPQDDYVKSLVRHVLDFWNVHRGGSAVDPERGTNVTAMDLACAIFFNIQGWMHEALKESEEE